MIELKDCGVVFEADPHRYTLDGVELSGITGLLHRQLFSEKYKGISEEVMNKAAERGTRIHEECRAFDVLGVAASEEAEDYAFLKALKGLETVGNEYTVTDFKTYASNIDVVLHEYGSADDAVALADIKTTSTFDAEYVSWQLSIYKYLFAIVNPGLTVTHLYGLWIPSKRYGKAQVIEVESKPVEEVVKLLDADAKGERYTPPVTVLPSELTEVQQQLTDIMRTIKRMEDRSKTIKAGILHVMEEQGIRKWETDDFTCSVVPGGERTVFDAKGFQKDHPGTYKEYEKKQKYNSSIRIKLKEDK